MNAMIRTDSGPGEQIKDLSARSWIETFISDDSVTGNSSGIQLLLCKEGVTV